MANNSDETDKKKILFYIVKLTILCIIIVFLVYLVCSCVLKNRNIFNDEPKEPNITIKTRKYEIKD